VGGLHAFNGVPLISPAAVGDWTDRRTANDCIKRNLCPWLQRRMMPRFSKKVRLDWHYAYILHEQSKVKGIPSDTLEAAQSS
jgi:hypothetical protein